MTRAQGLLTLMALTLVAPAAGHAACAGDPAPCPVANGTYHIVLPDRPGPHPAVVFLHGWGGSGAGIVGNSAMVDLFLARGYAVVAPDGQPREGRPGRTWDFDPNRPATRDETAFITAVADAAAARFGLTRDLMLLSGFSIGGSMTSYAACAEPAAFAAYAPIAGSFWRPEPADCAGPVRLLHTHGWADQTVPLEGRSLAPGIAEGDVFQALQIWRETDGCTAMRPDRATTEGLCQQRSWSSCLPGARLDFALHPGGHIIPEGWVTLALDWFETPS